MEVEKILYMNGGVGQSSYANNSVYQRSVTAKSKPVLEESIREVYNRTKPECFVLAELGCSSGRNALQVVSEIIDIVDEASRRSNQKAPEFGIFLNDLLGNDFNTLFNFLPEFYEWAKREKGGDFGPCFVSGTPKSFYGRLFSSQSIHFVHSGYSLHWLSQVPEGLMNKGVALNKGNICIGDTRPSEVHKAYYDQFKKDFTLFLRSRAKEVVPGGSMVFTFMGSLRGSHEADPMFDMISASIRDMISEGMIEEEKLDKFNLPFYLASTKEVKQLIEAEGSFDLNKLETFTLNWGIDNDRSLDEQATFAVKNIRAVFESLLASAFGEEFMDDLFSRLITKVHDYMSKQTGESKSIVVSMTRKLDGMNY